MAAQPDLSGRATFIVLGIGRRQGYGVYPYLRTTFDAFATPSVLGLPALLCPCHAPASPYGFKHAAGILGRYSYPSPRTESAWRPQTKSPYSGRFAWSVEGNLREKIHHQHPTQKGALHSSLRFTPPD